MRVLDHFRAKVSIFRTNTSKHFGVVGTTAGTHHQDIRRVFVEDLDHARSLAEFGDSDNSEIGGFLRSNRDGGSFSGAVVSST